MDLVLKVIKGLAETEFRQMVQEIAGTPGSKTMLFLEEVRRGELRENVLRDTLGFNNGAYYTFKSRLMPKLIAYYTNLRENRIRQLAEDAARVPFIVYNNDRIISLSFLKDLEKRLKEYDLSSELAVVYKHLARLHRFEPEYPYYEKEYKRHVAFSLSLVKAEDLLYEFIYRLGYYKISGNSRDRDDLENLLYELENTYNLYESHRLFVVYNIVRIYYMCQFADMATLKDSEIEIEEILQRFGELFSRFSLDPFYNSISHIVPFLYFEYYVRIQNKARATHYLQKIVVIPGSQFKAHLWSFVISQFINSVTDKYGYDADLEGFLLSGQLFKEGYAVQESEVSHLVIYLRYLALVEFYTGNYSKSALTINNLRNIVSLKDFPSLEIEMKLFQALQYAFNGDDELYEKLIASAKRQAATYTKAQTSVKVFAKFLFLLNKSKKAQVEKEKIADGWKKFKTTSGNPARLLTFIYLPRQELLRMISAM